ncbi:MAG: membrane protein insertase YidC [Deltaproteobacteria bacterium]|jgi:YidC/Oxa1 family membrane protein insertase|nr:membrane protein insertase YidC [Deltaproteobacteria bacterium]
MDKRTILTMAVMLAFLILVNILYPVFFPPPPEVKKPRPTTESQATTAVQTVVGDSVVNTASPGTSQMTGAVDQTAEPVIEPTEQGQSVPSRDITVETPEYLAVFTEMGGRLKSLTLNNYMATRLSRKEPEKKQELVVLSPGQSELPLALRIYVNESDFLDLSDLHFSADRESLKVETSAGKLVFTGRTAKGLVLERTFTFTPGSYLIGQEVKAKNESQTSAYGGRLGMTLVANPFAGKPGRYDNVAGYLGGKLFTTSSGKAASKVQDLGTPARPEWLGYMSQYFLTALILDGNSSGVQDPTVLRLQAASRSPQGVQLAASWPLQLNPGSAASYDFSVYYGPKENKSLDVAGFSLDQSIDLGWFGFLAKPLAYLLRMFYGIVGNYGLAIIIVTFLIKLALAPLTAKSYKSMKQMQKLQPRMQAVREKFKDDRESANKEMMQLYKTYKVNPLGGCLPMMLQIPFFIAFYRVLDYALELRGAPFMLWIQDLSAPDRLFDLGVTIPFLDPPTGIPVMTILMAGSMIWQQKMTPTMGDPMQAKIMMLMPLFFSIILLNMPAGLVLYWLVNNILSIIQQKFINRPEPASGQVAKPLPQIKNNVKKSK